MIDRSIPPKDPSDRDDDLNQNRKHNDELLGVPTHATRGELLLNAIHDDPENTNLRLLYADWLDNDGNNPSLASFIRTDVEFSTTTCPDRREELRGYCDDWVNEHWRMFFESAPSAQIPGVEVLTKMGLPHEISFKWNAFSSIPHAELRWLVSQPVVTSLSIPGSVSQRELQRVMTFCEELRHVTLAVEASWTSDLTKGLTCSRLNKLENLTISDAQAIDPRILAELTSFAPNIRKLFLKRCSFSEGFIAQQTSSVDSLKVIEIDTCSGLRKIDLCFLPAVLPNLEVFI